VDDEDSEEEVRVIPKRNGPTVHKNNAFKEQLLERQGKMTSDFLYANKLKVRQNSTQKISKPRMEVPDDVELHTYGS
jgi:hypothetical protein